MENILHLTIVRDGRRKTDVGRRLAQATKAFLHKKGLFLSAIDLRIRKYFYGVWLSTKGYHGQLESKKYKE